METGLTSSQDRILEEEPDADSQGVLSMLTAIWKSQSSEEYEAADRLQDLRLFSPSQFASTELFNRISFPPKLVLYHFCFLPICAML